MAEALVQTFLGNVGIGTDDPGAYKLKVNNSESSNIGPLEVSSLSINGTDNVEIPQNFIALWYGSSDSIPTGWYLCDGLNGTPDFRDYFAYGVTTSAFNTSGANSTILVENNIPVHTHSGYTGNQSANHSHTISGSHYHRENATDNAGRNDYTTSQAQNYYGQAGMGTFGATTGMNATQNMNANHNHSGSTNYTGSGIAFTTKPPYRALCFIMKA